MDERDRIQAAIDAMTRAFAAGDIEGVLGAYEPGAVLVAEPGKPAAGTPALRALFEGFIALKPEFTFFAHEVVEAGDIGLHLNTWRMRGTGPDGSAIEQGGLSIAVLRRQADGRWLMVIDHPFGDAILTRSGQ